MVETLNQKLANIIITPYDNSNKILHQNSLVLRSNALEIGGSLLLCKSFIGAFILWKKNNNKFNCHLVFFGQRFFFTSKTKSSATEENNVEIQEEPLEEQETKKKFSKKSKKESAELSTDPDEESLILDEESLTLAEYAAHLAAKENFKQSLTPLELDRKLKQFVDSLVDLKISLSYDRGEERWDEFMDEFQKIKLLFSEEEGDDKWDEYGLLFSEIFGVEDPGDHEYVYKSGYKFIKKARKTKKAFEKKEKKAKIALEKAEKKKTAPKKKSAHEKSII